VEWSKALYVADVMADYLAYEMILTWNESTSSWVLIIRGIFIKFLHFYIFAGNGEGGRSSNWSCLRVSCD